MNPETNETYEEAVERCNIQIDMSKKMQRLLDNPDFNEIFEEGFIRSWSVTNTYNIAKYDDATRRRVMEGMVARSHFTQFVEQIMADGNLAVDDLATLNEIAKQDSEDESEEYS